MQERNDLNRKNIVKFAGAFVAWVIGSGFATGQEMLQFFSSYGYWSFGIIIINLIGFLFMGQALLTLGYENKEIQGFNQFNHYCGKKLGKVYSWLIPITLLLIMPVLISGAGATLSEYYGVNRYIASAFMAVMVLIAYLIGFERLVRVVSSIGPIIIVFALVVGVITVFADYRNFWEIPKYNNVLEKSQSSPNWLISSVLYLSLNFLSGSTYFTQLGRTSNNRREAKYGAIIGAVAINLAIAIMSTSILLNAENTALTDIPMLYLANKISVVLGAVFSVVLMLGMFSSCSAMMWTVCSVFKFGGKKGNVIFAVLVTIFIYVLGLFSFSKLISVFYPMVGYVGLIYMFSLIKKELGANKTQRQDMI